jgi:hypothetical protein
MKRKSTSSSISIPEEIIRSRRDTSLSSDPEVPPEEIDHEFKELSGRITPPDNEKRFDEYVQSLKHRDKPHINTTGWNPESRSYVERMDNRNAYMEPGIEIYNKAAEENNGEKMEKKDNYNFTDIARLHAGLDIYYRGLEDKQSSEVASIQSRLDKRKKTAGRKTNKRKALKKKVKKTKRKSLKKRRKTKRRKN